MEGSGGQRIQLHVSNFLGTFPKEFEVSCCCCLSVYHISHLFNSPMYINLFLFSPVFEESNLFVCLFVCLFIWLFTCLYGCLLVCCLLVCFDCLFIRLFVCLFVCMFVYTVVCLFIWLFTCLFVCLLTHSFFVLLQIPGVTRVCPNLMAADWNTCVIPGNMELE